MRASSEAVFFVSLAPPAVPCAACATFVMFFAISELPDATSEMFRPISPEVVLCCSTAPAMAPWMSLIWWMIWLISLMESTATHVSP